MSLPSEGKGVWDHRKHKFTIVTNEVILDTKNIAKPIDKLVYVILCSYANNESKRLWPSVNQIASRSLCSENTARSSLHRLKEIGLIDIVHRKKEIGGQTSNVYILLEPPNKFEAS